MSNRTETTVTIGGTSVATVLFLIFLVLKLTDVIDWSWWWVTSPLWIPAGLVILAVLVWTLVVLILTHSDI